ncbi:putative GNAT family N-acyltransferase [Bacillus mesophilus]|uniref:GNAT family N-acetyltransferase n=1 Tax=Bacillus mesophilus TaxID=1808955 RepID=A0A6M0Q2F5_9BACI|nr:GNAT family N-acetyltransferase [Bacillus mesophilus]MBM7659699.1 putative GNAT family N-acyltransferase [Bacillus mesophilus]NEY70565.1 GNAT family N-acetyltransferase [Bacillus mesophilus]
MNVRVVTNDNEFNDALKVRRLVFIDEQQVPEEEEIDQYEQECTHVVMYDDNKQPIAAGRLRNVDGSGKMERICVLSSHRNLGLGKHVMDHLEMLAKEKGYKKLKLNAQTHAEGFYSKLGYQTISDIFMDAGIPHVTMVKEV